MNNNNIEPNTMLAYNIIKDHYENDYDELVDALYHYMHSYLFEDGIDLILYADEFEMYTGKTGTVEEVINYIIKMRR